MKSLIDLVSQTTDTRPVHVAVAKLHTSLPTTKHVHGLSVEGYKDDMAGEVTTMVTGLQASIDQAFLGMERTHAQRQAGVVAGLMSSSNKMIQESFAIKLQGPQDSDAIVLTPNIAGASMSRTDTPGLSASMEAYEVPDNTNLQAFSIAWNTAALIQDRFNAVFYPAVTLAPNQAGISITARTAYVMDSIKRNANGAADKFNRKNIINAVVDATILAADSTDIIPVYRKATPANALTDTFDYFVPGVSPQSYLSSDGQSIPTSYLAFGKEVGLLGISQTDAMLAQGNTSETETLDSDVRLDYVLLKLVSGGTTEYVSLDVRNAAGTQFNLAPQGNSQQLSLNFVSKGGVALDRTTAMLDGNPSTILAGLGQNTLRLRFSVNGNATQDTGTAELTSGSLGVNSVADSSGQLLAPADAGYASATSIIASASLVGYKLRARRTNADRAKAGKLLDLQWNTYFHNVPVLAPMSAKRPVTGDAARDSELMQELVHMTRTRQTNEAVTSFLQWRDLLDKYASQPDVATANSDLFGHAGRLVKPRFRSENLDVFEQVASLSTDSVVGNIRALVINKIRDMAARLYTETNYGPASRYYYAGVEKKPTIYIACDPVVHQWLTVDGDTRLLGAQFDYEIVEVWDGRFKGKLAFSFGQADAVNSNSVDLLHFGQTLWRPELVVALPMNRGNSQSHEMTVRPSFSFVHNLPIMGELNIQNLDKAIGSKVAVFVENQVL